MYSRHSIIKSVEFISEYNIAYRTDIAELIVLQAELVVIPGSTTTENNGRMSTTIEDSKARIVKKERIRVILIALTLLPEANDLFAVSEFAPHLFHVSE